MEVVSVGGANASCPDGKGRTDTDYTTLFWNDATICFAANLVEGDCYSVDTSSEGMGSPFSREDCADASAQVRVIQRFDGTASPALCDAGTNPIAYVQIARLYCLGQAHE